MASSSSSARRRKGKDTSEYKVVRGHFGPLVKQSQHVLTNFANELFSKMLISKQEHSDAINKNQPMYDRATAMMNSVLDKIDHDSACFCVLVACLKEAEQNSIAEDLEEALKEDKQHCTSMPGATRLPQNIVGASSTRGEDTTSESTNNTIATTDETLEDPVEPGGLKFKPSVTESGSMLLPQGSVLVPSKSEDSEPQEDDSIAERDHYNISQSREDQNVLQPILEEGSTKPKAAPIFSVSSGSLASVKSTEKFKFPSRTLPHCMSVDRQLATRSLRQLTSGYGKAYRSSPIGGDTMDFCIKPVHPLAGNPLVDALNVPILSPIKLVKMRSVEEDNFQCCSLSSPGAQTAAGEDLEPLIVQETPISEEQKPASEPRHPMVKRNSFQSVCICHVKIEFLHMKLGNRMKEIDILKSQIEQLEVHFEEERKRRKEAVETQAKLKAKRDKEVRTLEDEIASKDKLVHQLEWEKVQFEKEIEELRNNCENTEEKKQVAEWKASVVARKMLSRCGELEKQLLDCELKAEEYKLAFEKKSSNFEKLREKLCSIEKEHECKVEDLETKLAEAKRREMKLKRQMVRTGYETVKSEMVAGLEACIDEKNATSFHTLAPLLQRRVERELRRATQELDVTGRKIAEELIRKTSRLIMAASNAQTPIWTISGSETRGEIRALDLVTPDKDMELTW